MKRKRDNEVMEQSKGDGVQWYRCEMIGKGSFGSVYLAKLKKPESKFACFPKLMAVKLAEVSLSGSIQKEREVLQNIGESRYIIKCFGEETTNGSNGEMVYNLLLEFGSGGTLDDLIKKSDGSGLPELEVRYYARSILLGLKHIHESGYVHCDLKPENILLVNNNCDSTDLTYKVKIGDFGSAKRATTNKNVKKLDLGWRGTYSYLSPEIVLNNVQEAPSDIWALGCVVFELLTGKPVWGPLDDVDSKDLLNRIGKNGELPKIPDKVSNLGREFLKGCFARNPKYRLTADMLLNHSFLEGLVDEMEESVDENDDDDDCIDIVDDSGLSFVGYETDEECDYAPFSDEEDYAFDTDGIWSDEENVNKKSEFHDEAKAKEDVLSNVLPHNTIIPFTVQAGV